MTNNRTERGRDDAPPTNTHRRRFLQGIGVTGAVLGGGATPALAKGKEPLESEASDVAFDIYAGQDNTGDGEVNNPLRDFGFPAAQVIAGTDARGALFDTSALEITPNGKTIDHALRFVQGALIVNRPKPYIIHHDDGGRYTSRGATINFEVGGEEKVPPPIDLLLNLLPPGKYRTVVNDVVQLSEKGGQFDWAVTRADFYTRGNGEPTFNHSLVYVLWDYDDSEGDPGDAGNPSKPGDNVPPSIPDPAITSAALDLITSGRANLGGQ